MARKTVSVSDMVDAANIQLARIDQWSSAEMRRGVIAMVEAMMFAADQYAGFRYLTNNELPDDVLPGVRYNGTEILDPIERFRNTDETRRFYFVKKV